MNARDPDAAARYRGDAPAEAPLAEEATLGLMRARVCPQPGAARDSLRSRQQALKEEMGLSPSAAMRTLCGDPVAELEEHV